MSDQDVRDLVVSWLNNAHAMETQLISVLQNHLGDNRYPPEALARFQQHLQETRTHADRVTQCVTLLGSSTSTVKSGLGSLMGSFQAASVAFFDDALTRNALIDYASEQFEVAAYKALITATRELGLLECVALLEQNRMEDEAMALWLDQQLQPIVISELRQCAAAR